MTQNRLLGDVLRSRPRGAWDAHQLLHSLDPGGDTCHFCQRWGFHGILWGFHGILWGFDRDLIGIWWGCHGIILQSSGFQLRFDRDRPSNDGDLRGIEGGVYGISWDWIGLMNFRMGLNEDLAQIYPQQCRLSKGFKEDFMGFHRMRSNRIWWDLNGLHIDSTGTYLAHPSTKVIS